MVNYQNSSQKYPVLTSILFPYIYPQAPIKILIFNPDRTNPSFCYALYESQQVQAKRVLQEPGADGRDHPGVLERAAHLAPA